MQEIRHALPRLDPFHLSFTEKLPARAVLAAVLETAYRDLNSYMPLEFRKSAVEWFQDPDYGTNEAGFTFRFVKFHLDLNDTQLAFIERRVKLVAKEIKSISGGC